MLESGTVEITELGRRFNKMLERLEETTVSRDSLLSEIATREEVQKQLEKSEHLFKNIVEQAAEAIVMIDRVGTVQIFNPVAQRMFGFSADEIVGRNVSVLLPPGIAIHHDSYLERYQQSRTGKIVGKGLRQEQGRKRERGMGRMGERE